VAGCSFIASEQSPSCFADSRLLAFSGGCCISKFLYNKYSGHKFTDFECETNLQERCGVDRGFIFHSDMLFPY
jgi:hypothetical protein